MAHGWQIRGIDITACKTLFLVYDYLMKRTFFSTHFICALAYVSPLLLGLSACASPSPIDAQQKQLAGNIYAQLAMGYMTSGHLDLAEQRLTEAQVFYPQGELTLKAQQQWLAIQETAAKNTSN